MDRPPSPSPQPGSAASAATLSPPPNIMPRLSPRRATRPSDDYDILSPAAGAVAPLSSPLSSTTPHKQPAPSPATKLWQHTPIQYKPSLWMSPIFGLVQFGILVVLVRWIVRTQPFPVTLTLGILSSAAFSLYMRWQYSIVAELEEDSAHTSPTEYSLQQGHVHVKGQGPVESLMMTRPMSRADCLWYFVHVTLNFQLNTFCRIGRTIYSVISELVRFGTLCHGDHQQNYWFLMNSSQNRWLCEDGHIRFPNATLPVVLASRTTSRWQRVTDFFRGNTVHTFKEVVFELDHERHRLVAARLDEARITDPYECMVFITILQGLYSHPQVHLIAAEVGRCGEWSLAHSASNAANGLNHAAVMAIGPVITRHHEEYVTIPGLNHLNGTPHPKGGRVHQLLFANSHTYRMMLRAHRDLLIRQYAGPDPVAHAALLHSSLLHGVDHLLPDLYAPFWLRSKTFGSNFTGTLLFGAGVNIDFTSRFAKVQDELTRRLYEIACEEAPLLAPGWQWAVAQ